MSGLISELWKSFSSTQFKNWTFSGCYNKFYNKNCQNSLKFEYYNVFCSIHNPVNIDSFHFITLSCFFSIILIIKFFNHCNKNRKICFWEDLDLTP